MGRRHVRVPLTAIGRSLLAAVLLAAASCSPGGSSSPQADKQETAADTTQATVAATPAATSAPAARAAAPSAPRAEQGERRCGWLSNPTPGNWWLTDSDGEWILATQGGEQARGMDEMPDMSGPGWVETNGHYGYGCACMTIAHDPRTRRVTRIANAEPKPLSQCRADDSLPRPE